MDQQIVGLLCVFLGLPLILVGGRIASRWMKLKEGELQLRREELELQKKKIEFLTAETNREILEKLDRDL